MFFKVRSLILVVGAYGAAAGTINAIDCRSQGEIGQVTFSNCDSFPCQISRNKTYYIQVALNPAQDHNSLDLAISYIYGGLETPLDSSNVGVSVTHGKSDNLDYPWTVFGRSVPTQSVGVRVKLEADGVIEFCGIIPANMIA